MSYEMAMNVGSGATKWALYAVGGVGVALAGYVLARRAAGDARAASAIIGDAIGRGAVSAVSGAVTGAVKGAGAAVGIPDTNADRCTEAKAAGDVWAASLYCPADDFLRWSANRLSGWASGRSKPVAATSRRPTLRLGSRGDDVRVLQKRLGLDADGIFGPQTESAVRGFQSGVGLIPDGVVGPHTWAALESGRAVVNQDGVLILGADRGLIR